MNIGQLKELTDRLDTLIERNEPMKDEMYNAFRSYLEEHSSLLRQILEEVKGKGTDAKAIADAIDTRLMGVSTPEETKAPAVKMPAEAVGNVTVETVQPSGATTVQTLDSGKEDDAAKGKPQGGKPGAKPNVNWNSAPIKE